MYELDRAGLALKLQAHLRVRVIGPRDDDYTGDGVSDQHVIEGIAEAAEELARERAQLLRFLESAQRHYALPNANHFAIADHMLMGAIALLREGKVPEKMMEGAG